MPNYLFFFIGLSLLLGHEMDAIRLKEWRMFLVLQQMSEEAAYRAFTVIHVPLYSVLFLTLFSGVQGTINLLLVVGLDLFFVVHIALHILFRNHKHNQFTTLFSRTLIFGAGVAGGIDLLVRIGG